MDAMYMQEGKIVYKCEIVTITYTSHCEYETYNACVSILHIYAYMTFALRTHNMLDELHICFCNATYMHYLFDDINNEYANATYMALRNYSDIYILCFIVCTCDKYSMQYKLQIVQCDVYLIKKNLIYIS